MDPVMGGGMYGGGGIGDESVWSVQSVECAGFPASSSDTTRKWYVVPSSSPVRLTEWLVVKALLRAEREP
ncbi:hypothetical protein ES703_118052 [subsurface metagenome]